MCYTITPVKRKETMRKEVYTLVVLLISLLLVTARYEGLEVVDLREV